VFLVVRGRAVPWDTCACPSLPPRFRGGGAEPGARVHVFLASPRSPRRDLATRMQCREGPETCVHMLPAPPRSSWGGMAGLRACVHIPPPSHLWPPSGGLPGGALPRTALGEAGRGKVHAYIYPRCPHLREEGGAGPVVFISAFLCHRTGCTLQLWR
jgi:hypothetical protein